MPGTSTATREQAARDFAAGYVGTFEFMTAMRTRVADPRPLSERQVDAILRCAARERPRPVPVQLQLERDRANVVVTPAPARTPVTEPGMYSKDDEIFKVQRSRQSGGLYAKRLVQIGGRRLTEDDGVVNFEFEYARGAVYELSADDRMSHAEAVAFGIKYGVCCVCGRGLRDATSVAEGIGPVCGGRI